MPSSLQVDSFHFHFSSDFHFHFSTVTSSVLSSLQVGSLHFPSHLHFNFSTATSYMPSSFAVGSFHFTSSTATSFLNKCLCLGSCVVFCGDIWLQLHRKGSVSDVAKPFIAIFIINILLWVDFNVTIWRRKKRNKTPTRMLRSKLTHLGHHL